MRPLFSALLICLLVLSACAPVPRPFQPESKVSVDLRAPSTRAPLRVGAPEGQAPGNANRFTLKVAEQLLTLGVAAEPQWFSMTAAPALETRRLQSRAAVSEVEGGNEKVEIAWSLVSPAGREEPLTVARVLLPRGAWASDTPNLVDDAAYVSAAAIARALGTTLPSFASGEGEAAAPRVVVLPVEGASGDGAESLEYSITRALREEGIALAAVPQEQDLLLWSLVEIGPVQQGVQLVSVHWRLDQAEDFTEIGTVTQENLVPAYSLAGAWRDSAAQIAQAAAEGIAALMQQAGISTTEHQPTTQP